MKTTQKHLKILFLETNSNTILDTADDQYILLIERRCDIVTIIISIWP